MNLTNVIMDTMKEAAASTNCNLAAQLNHETVLLESGLDSLGFAILVALLEERLGYDPFTLMADAVYPRTLGEFIAIYQRYA